jgi:uncharacterized membrane protein
MLFGSFLLFYILAALTFLTVVFVLIQVQLFTYALTVLGLPPRIAVLALMASLLGSYINIPLYSVDCGPKTDVQVVNNYGLEYAIPNQYADSQTTVAINVGGAIVPVLIALYALISSPGTLFPSLLATIGVAAVTHYFASPVRGLGIALPMFIPPLAALLCAVVVRRGLSELRPIPVVAYVSGVFGTLIGADLMNLDRVANLGAPVASIGGAGTADGVFLTGIIAVLMALFHTQRAMPLQYRY